MWREFEWRFWRDEGRREVPDDVDLDPHYREMLKVVLLAFSDFIWY